jgi:two-component system LytT family response regulator
MKEHPLKVIVVDDEMPSREALSTYIRDYCPGIEIVAECECVKSAYNAIISKQPQLVFLDIEMPNGNGFDLLKMFKIPPFKVIFVTAYSDHAIKAFRFSASDYLLKPVKVDELVDAVNKVRSDISQKMGFENITAQLENLPASDHSLNNLVISDTKGFTIVKISDLILCNGEGYVTHFFMTGHRKVSSSKNLKYYEELLEPLGIIRVHHSWLVNLNYVKGYNRQGEIILHEDMRCPLGSSYKNRFMELVSKLR